MKKLENEEVLWESEKKAFVLTTHRFRVIKKVFLNDTIKSIMLENINSVELYSIKDVGYVRRALAWFLSLNGGVYILNQFFFDSKLIQKLIGEFSISGTAALVIFYLSIGIVVLNMSLFLHSVKKVFAIHAHSLTVHVELKSMSFEEREFFLSRIEDAMDKRYRSLNSNFSTRE